MTDEQFAKITKMLDNVLDNQVILDKKLTGLQNDLHDVVHKQNILLHDQDELLSEVKTIKQKLNK